MNQIPLNPMEDGTCRPIKSQYWKNSLANFVRGTTAVIVIEDVQAECEAIGRVP